MNFIQFSLELNLHWSPSSNWQDFDGKGGCENAKRVKFGVGITN